METFNLNERERAILRNVIHQFILTANPVGSRNISKKYNLGLSPATIRNIMADLEETGLLGHPHPSAGRVPTDSGYRVYVDSLMDPPVLSKYDKQIAQDVLDTGLSDADNLIKATSTILSDITNQLALVTYPKMSKSILEKIQIVQLSSSRILVVVTVKSGLVKTITLELDAVVQKEKLDLIQRILNERLSGLRFSEIRKTIAERIKNYNKTELKPIIRVFLDSAEKIFTDDIDKNKSVITGANKILTQPEFEDHQRTQSIIELAENKDIIIHIMDDNLVKEKSDFTITIGKEINNEKLDSYSIITKQYKIGNAYGTVGIIGPKRMEYSKIVAAVIFVAEILSKELKKI